MGRKTKTDAEKKPRKASQEDSRAKRRREMGDEAYLEMVRQQRRDSRARKREFGTAAAKEKELDQTRVRGGHFRANEKAREAGEPLPFPLAGAVAPPAAPPAAEVPPADPTVAVPGGSGETPRRHLTPRRPRRTNNPLVRTFKIYNYHKNYAKCMQSFKTQERALSMILKEITTE